MQLANEKNPEIDKAIRICLDKLINNIYDKPTFLFKLHDTLINNPDFCERLVKLDKENEYDFTMDLLHDISGLMRKDTHFLPRI